MSDWLQRLQNAGTRFRSSTDSWLMGALARLLLAATLVPYYYAAGQTKVGEGFAGFFDVQAGAYAQIVPPVAEQYLYDASVIPLVPWKLIVIFGTYAEFLLPTLLVLGLFTRFSGIGMLGFIIVQSYVDIAFHGVTGADVGAFFDGDPTSAILDQRAFWAFPILYLVIFGAGGLSLDRLLQRWRQTRMGSMAGKKVSPQPATA